MRQGAKHQMGHPVIESRCAGQIDPVPLGLNTGRMIDDRMCQAIGRLERFAMRAQFTVP